MPTYLVKYPHRNSRVHASANGTRPDCGGGNGGRATQWQRDIGPGTCAACKKVAHWKNTQLSTPPPERAAATTAAAL
jgi:hypothetical protein